MIVTALITIPLGMHVHEVKQAKRQKQARLELSKGGNLADFRVSEGNDPNNYFYVNKTSIHQWMSRWLGEDYLADVIYVGRTSKTTRHEFEVTKRLRGVRAIFLKETDIIKHKEWVSAFPNTVIAFYLEDAMYLPDSLSPEHREQWVEGYGYKTILSKSDIFKE